MQLVFNSIQEVFAFVKDTAGIFEHALSASYMKQAHPENDIAENLQKELEAHENRIKK